MVFLQIKTKKKPSMCPSHAGSRACACINSQKTCIIARMSNKTPKHYRWLRILPRRRWCRYADRCYTRLRHKSTKTRWKVSDDGAVDTAAANQLIINTEPDTHALTLTHSHNFLFDSNN